MQPTTDPEFTAVLPSSVLETKPVLICWPPLPTLKMWIFVENEKKVWNNSEVKMTKSLFPMIHISTSVARRPYHVSEESPPVSVTILHIKYYSQYET